MHDGVCITGKILQKVYCTNECEVLAVRRRIINLLFVTPLLTAGGRELGAGVTAGRMDQLQRQRQVGSPHRLVFAFKVFRAGPIRSFCRWQRSWSPPRTLISNGARQSLFKSKPPCETSFLKKL